MRVSEERRASISASSSSEATGVRGLPSPASDEWEGSEEKVSDGGVAGGELGGGDDGGRSSRNVVVYARAQVGQEGWGFVSCLRVCLTGRGLWASSSTFTFLDLGCDTFLVGGGCATTSILRRFVCDWARIGEGDRSRLTRSAVLRGGTGWRSPVVGLASSS